MSHLPLLIQDLAVILITAAITTLLFRALRQPVVLGYMIAGFLVGPHIKWVPDIQEIGEIRVWAEIGVIFLLFGLGLEFSFRRLVRVGRPALMVAMVEVPCMMGLGYLVGRALGWSFLDALFLGGILAISSTSIIVRAFAELNVKGQAFTQLVYGVLVVEDIFAVLLLVLLSTVSVTQTFSGADLAFSGLKLISFLVAWFALGLFLLPKLVRWLKPLLTDETLLIVSLGLCLFMVWVATESGFSPALGAFVMGSLLAETELGHKIEELSLPVRDLFAAIFFVSIGMLIDPSVLTEYAFEILLIVAVHVLGKITSVVVGARIAGQSWPVSVQTGMSLAQIGEFSFIIATLGVSLKVTSPALYPIAVAVSALTTFATPYLIHNSKRLIGNKQEL